MRSQTIVDFLMNGVHDDHKRFCNPGPLGCACMGCVNNNFPFIDKDEWEDWKRRHNFCENCGRYDIQDKTQEPTNFLWMNKFKETT